LGRKQEGGLGKGAVAARGAASVYVRGKIATPPTPRQEDGQNVVDNKGAESKTVHGTHDIYDNKRFTYEMPKHCILFSIG
jgi:hypothetical protein